MPETPPGMVIIPDDYYLHQKERKQSGVQKTQHLLGFELVKGYGGLIHIHGAEFPRKGIIKADAMDKLDVVKRVIRELPKYPYIFLLTSNNQLLKSFNSLYERAMHYDKAKQEYLCGAAQGMQKMAYIFLTEIGVNEEIAKETAFNLAQFMECDDAYRYRVQDNAHEASVRLFRENPRKELKRLVSLWEKRELLGVVIKLSPLISKLNLLLLVPKYKRAFLQAIEHIKEMDYDAADWYWVRQRKDYNFAGLSYEERMIGVVPPTEHEVEVIYKD